MRFALGPLPLTFDLEIALGDVVADAVAGDMIERVGLGDVFGAGADDGGDLDFPVELVEPRGFSTLSLGRSAPCWPSGRRSVRGIGFRLLGMSM